MYLIFLVISIRWRLIRDNHTTFNRVSLWLNYTPLDCKPIHKAGQISRQKCDQNISEPHGLIMWWRRRKSMSRLLSPLILSSINRYRKKTQELADSSQIAGGLAATTETNTAAIACPWRSRNMSRISCNRQRGNRRFTRPANQEHDDICRSHAEAGKHKFQT
jgi:hypothetical protein